MTDQVATGMTTKFYGFAPELGWAFGILLIASYPPIVATYMRLRVVNRTTTDQRVKKQVNLLRNVLPDFVTAVADRRSDPGAHRRAAARCRAAIAESA